MNMQTRRVQTSGSLCRKHGSGKSFEMQQPTYTISAAKIVFAQNYCESTSATPTRLYINSFNSSNSVYPLAPKQREISIHGL